MRRGSSVIVDPKPAFFISRFVDVRYCLLTRCVLPNRDRGHLAAFMSRETGNLCRIIRYPGVAVTSASSVGFHEKSGVTRLNWFIKLFAQKIKTFFNKCGKTASCSAPSGLASVDKLRNCARALRTAAVVNARYVYASRLFFFFLILIFIYRLPRNNETDFHVQNCVLAMSRSCSGRWYDGSTMRRLQKEPAGRASTSGSAICSIVSVVCPLSFAPAVPLRVACHNCEWLIFQR